MGYRRGGLGEVLASAARYLESRDAQQRGPREIRPYGPASARGRTRRRLTRLALGLAIVVVLLGLLLFVVAVVAAVLLVGNADSVLGWAESVLAPIERIASIWNGATGGGDSG